MKCEIFYRSFQMYIYFDYPVLIQTHTMLEDAIHVIKGIMLLDESGDRIYAKYYTDDFKLDVKKQRHFEEKLHKQTKNMKAYGEAEVAIIQGIITVFKFDTEGCFYVICDVFMSAVVLEAVLMCFYTCIDKLFDGKIEKRLLLENFALIILTVDEMLDGGVILDIDPDSVITKVTNISDFNSKSITRKDSSTNRTPFNTDSDDSSDEIENITAVIPEKKSILNTLNKLFF